MKTPLRNRYLRYTILGGLLAVQLGCATSMEMVEQNLAEGRFVPEAAVATHDFLSEYRHPLPEPRSAMLGLNIDMERSNLLISGGKTLVQVGLQTQQPRLRPVNLHVLAFAPPDPETTELGAITDAVQAIRTQTRVLPQGSSLTVDLINPINGLDVTEPPYMRKKQDGNLKAFLATFAQRPFDRGDHHAVLVVGSYKGFLDLPGISEREKQDVVDIARILAAKSVTLSVLSVGTKPDFAFLHKLSETGNGTFHVATESLDPSNWIHQDLLLRGAEVITDIELTVKTKNGARLTRALAPDTPLRANNIFTDRTPKLRQGQQRVWLVEVKVPAKGAYPTNEILDISARYYTPATKRYNTAHKTASISYVYDPNRALPKANTQIDRSLTILRTPETLRSVANEIRNRRNYQAIALLTKQSRDLKNMGERLNDSELLRDAAIMAKYADLLYDFDGDWLKGVKIWKDLSWDTDRFRAVYK